MIKESGKTVFEVSIENTDIEKEMLSSFNSKNIKNELEYSYRLKTRINKPTLQSPSYEIEKVSKSLLKNIESYKNYNMLTNRIDNSWYSHDNFLEKSISHIALNQNSIVGVCFGSALYNGYITVDIEININHRRKSIASTLVKNFVNEAISRNYIVQWDRVESNVASKLLAEKFGFNLFKVRPYYWFEI